GQSAALIFGHSFRFWFIFVSPAKKGFTAFWLSGVTQKPAIKSRNQRYSKPAIFWSRKQLLRLGTAGSKRRVERPESKKIILRNYETQCWFEPVLVAKSSSPSGPATTSSVSPSFWGCESTKTQ